MKDFLMKIDFACECRKSDCTCSLCIYPHEAKIVSRNGQRQLILLYTVQQACSSMSPCPDGLMVSILARPSSKVEHSRTSAFTVLLGDLRRHYSVTRVLMFRFVRGRRCHCI